MRHPPERPCNCRLRNRIERVLLLLRPSQPIVAPKGSCDKSSGSSSSLTLSSLSARSTRPTALPPASGKSAGRGTLGSRARSPTNPNFERPREQKPSTWSPAVRTPVARHSLRPVLRQAGVLDASAAICRARAQRRAPILTIWGTRISRASSKSCRCSVSNALSITAPSASALRE